MVDGIPLFPLFYHPITLSSCHLSLVNYEETCLNEVVVSSSNQIKIVEILANKMTMYYLRHLQTQIRKISTQVTTYQKSHYDALGVSSKATQADVKSAYYKLSMIYHPDRNKDSEEAAKKFRDITEAYEVLGNVKTRKLYDRGLFFQSATSTGYNDSPVSKFYKSRETKSRPPTTYGRTTVYDFDEWSRSHYGTTLQRDLKYKAQQKFKRQRAAQAAEDVKSEQVIFLVCLFVLLSAYLLVDKNYDSVQTVTIPGAGVVLKPKTD